MTAKPTEKRTRYAAFILIIVFVTATMAAISFYYISGAGTRSATSYVMTGSYSSSTVSNYPNGRAYLNVPKLYSGLGYPKVRYTDYSPYLASKPNFTMEYQTKNMSFQVGNVTALVINLDQAVGLAAKKDGLNPSNYSLAYAAFYPGTIVNSTLAIHPMWYLFFAASYEGFWSYGSYGTGAYSVEADVDALNGIFPANSGGVELSSLPASGHYELKVNSSRALAAVRAGNVSGVPSSLTENGTVTSMEPRIVLLGPSSNNAAFQNPMNASLSGEKRLCWIIQLYSPTPGYGYQGTFGVDAETGLLVSGWAQALYPSMHVEYAGLGSLEFSSARNLTVSIETFQIDGSNLGRSGSVPVTVPNVLLIKPGWTGSMQLNFSSQVSNDINATLSFTNPLPGFQTLSTSGLPNGVSVQLTRQAFVVPGKGSTTTTLLISASKNAPSGTYLIEVNAKLTAPQWAHPGRSYVLFFLTVWNGAGQWPQPPIIR